MKYWWWSMTVRLCNCFFFQAEDGIRDRDVTGVQTCALPIWGLWLWRQALVVRPELRGRFVLVASEPLPEPRSLALFLETERFVLKPIALEMLWHHVEDVFTRAATTETGARAEPRVSGAQRAESAP